MVTKMTRSVRVKFVTLSVVVANTSSRIPTKTPTRCISNHNRQCDKFNSDRPRHLRNHSCFVWCTCGFRGSGSRHWKRDNGRSCRGSSLCRNQRSKTAGECWRGYRPLSSSGCAGLGIPGWNWFEVCAQNSDDYSGGDSASSYEDLREL